MGLNFGGNLFPGGIKDETGTFQSDWKGIVEQGTLIIKDSGHDGDTATVTLYTVPAGKKLYLFYGTLTMISRAINAGGDAELQIDGEAILRLLGSDLDEASRQIINNFPVPLLLVAGTVIRSFNGGATDQHIAATIGGYLF